MGEIVTLELPEPVAQSARAVAEHTSRRVEDVLVEWLDRAASDLPVELLSDEQVLALRDLQMDDKLQQQLRSLLAGQREQRLTDEDRARLDDVLAVERGLQPPLS